MILVVAFFVTFVTHEVAGFKSHTVGFEERCNTFVDLALGLAGFAMAVFVVFTRLGVGGDNAFEIAKDNLVGALRDDIGRHNGSFATAAGGVDHKGGNGIAAGVSAEVLDDFDTLADGGTEMLKTHREVALINVVGTYTVLDQFVHEFLHYMHTVVHATEQHGLVAEGDAGVSQFGNSGLSLGGHLVGMVEMSVEPDGVILLEHVAEVVGDALGANDGSAAADADNLYVRDGAEAGDDVLKFLVADHKSVATAEEDVAHLGGFLDVLETLFDTVLGRLVIFLSSKTTACAVTAVHGAHVGDEEKHTVGIAVGETGSGRILVLVQGVVEVGGSNVALSTLRDALATNGIVRVVGINEAEIIRGDGHAEFGKCLFDAIGLLGREGEVFAEFFVGLDAVLDLPFPIIPLLVGDGGEEFFSAVDFHKI